MRQSPDRTLIAVTAVLVLFAGTTAEAQTQQSTPPPYNARDEQASWIADPHIHQFYEATVDAFAKGPDQIDRAAFEKRSHEIFRAMAISRNMSPEALLDHLARIPGEVILIATRDPKTLDSYQSFVDALFGPQMRSGVTAPATR